MRQIPIRELLRQTGRPGTSPTGRRLAALAVLATSLLVPSGATASGPSITPTIRGTLGSNGWYVSNVTVNWAYTLPVDSTSGCDAFTLTAETSGTSRTCSATWGSTTISYTVTIKIDKTPPSVQSAASRSPDVNGWYNHPLTVAFSGTDAMSGLAGCSSAASYDGPDTPGAAVYGTCRDNAGNTGTGATSLKYDATPPAVRAAVSRPPDANGWYNHPLSLSFAGTDTMSGVAGCSSTSYSGPDNPRAAISGTCHDNAGNTGRAALTLAYDATPPVLQKVSVKHFNRSVLLRWITSPDTQLTEVTRSSDVRDAKTATVYRGPAKTYRDRQLHVGAKYQYTVTVFDQAMNSASKKRSVTATGPLLSPVPGARVSSAPRLVWTPVKGATYYNVQLIRGKKILSAWPRKAELKLPRRWTYKGHRYRLRRGLYQWYVWPGFGVFSAGRYGSLLGGSSFIFAG